MPQSRGGLGNKKHGTSGHSGKSPRFKFMRELESNREINKHKQKSKLAAKTVSEAIKLNGGKT